jgi:hypothetical protein
MTKIAFMTALFCCLFILLIAIGLMWRISFDADVAALPWLAINVPILGYRRVGMTIIMPLVPLLMVG